VKILVADDDANLVILLKAFLEECHWEVAVARDAMQAGMLTRRETPDAILLDINMPGGSGIRVLKQLKASPRFQHIPVVVMSARDEAELPRAMAELGAARVMRKPLTLPAVHETLVELVGQPA
jgi:DNA-binding response OmpR family regulator